MISLHFQMIFAVFRQYQPHGKLGICIGNEKTKKPKAEESTGKASDQAGRASEPAGRASKPAGRLPESAGRDLEPAGRPQGGRMIELTDGKSPRSTSLCPLPGPLPKKGPFEKS